jgi:hypothetical protein
MTVEYMVAQAGGVRLGFLRSVCARFEALFARRNTQMSIIKWLEENALGFRDLAEEERSAIMQFSFLWSLFEAKALNTHGNANAILRVSERWEEAGLLTDQTFKRELAYFQNRYCAEGGFTYHFDHLHLRPPDKPDLVQRVLKGEEEDLSEIAAAVLIIVYRFRNNLFHGVKWSYQIRGQLENFNHANAILMQAVDLHEAAAGM